MRFINSFGRRLAISRWSEQYDSTKAMRFSDHSSALAFLRKVQRSGVNISVFRNVLKAEQDGTALHLIGDHQVLEQLSRMLCSGRIKLHEPGSIGTEHAEAADSTSERRERPSGSGAGRRPEPTLRREPRPMPPPKPRSAPVRKPSPAIDIDQQIAILRAAAIDGTPFCEQCERSRIEREAAR